MSNPAKRLELRIFLLGDFSVERGGQPLPRAAWHRRASARTLIKLLAVAPGHRLHREQIIDLLWPEVDIHSSLNRFAKALHAARRALEPELSSGRASAHLHLTDDILSLDLSNICIDADVFEAMAQQAIATEDATLCQQAIEAYRGELLPEDRYEDWAGDRRQALLELYKRVLIVTGRNAASQGLNESALTWLQQVIATDSTYEEVHRDVMHLHALLGNRNAAIRQYQSLVEALQAELGESPSFETEELYRAIVNGTIVREPGASEPVIPRPQNTLPSVVSRARSVAMVGRGRVLRTALDRFDDASQGRGSVILIGGESGVGKSRLAAEVAGQARERGAVVLWGASDPGTRLVPYGCFVELLGSYVSRLPPDELAVLTSGYPALTRLMPSLAPPETEHRLDRVPDGDHGGLFVEIVRLLAALSSTNPLILVLDDLQNLDVTVLQLLQHLARTASEHPWLIIGNYLSEDLTPGSQLHRAVSTLVRREWAQHIVLGRLSREESECLVEPLLPGGTVDAAVMHRLYSLSLGNPLFLGALVQTMRDEGQLELVDEVWRMSTRVDMLIPRRIQDVVEERLADLPRETRQVLDVAAVIGMEAPASLIEEASEVGRASLLDALDEAVDAHILEERGDAYAFSHPLFRATLFQDLSRLRRVHLHGRVGEAIEARRPDDVALLAYHYGESTNDEKAATYLRRAADAALAVHAYEGAEQNYSALLHRLARLGRVRDAAEARRLQAACLIALARYSDAVAGLDACLEEFKLLGELEGLANSVALLGHAYFHSLQAVRGIRRIRDFLDTTPVTDVPPLALARVFSVLCALNWSIGRYPSQLEYAEQATALAEQYVETAEGRLVLAQGLAWRGIALATLGRRDDSITVLERAATLAEAAGDLNTLSRALNAMGAVYEELGDLPRALEFTRRGLEAARNLGDPARTALMLARLGKCHLLVGEWQTAAEAIEQAVALSTDVASSWPRPFVWLQLGWILFLRGDWEGARRALEDAATLGDEAGIAIVRWGTQAVLAQLDLAMGRPGEARGRLKRFAGDPALSGTERVRLAALLARVDLSEGDAVSALERLDNVLDDPYTVDPPAKMDVLLVRGVAARVLMRAEDTDRNFADALDLSRDLAMPYHEARVLMAWGEPPLREDDREVAQQRVRDARDIFQRLGASKDLERAEAMLAREPR